jgi:REP element-mobilizing transposase RayT
MPDHVHFFVAMTDESRELELWMKYWKRLFHSAHSHTEWEWQSGHWDTRMRTPAHYQEKWEYVLNNPVRHGLVSTSELWPYQGQLFELPWD